MSKFFLCLFFLLLSFLCLSSFNYLRSPLSSQDASKIEFIIETGQDLDTITKNLKNQNLIRSPSSAKLLIFIKGISKQIQAGYFYLSPSQNLDQIITSLTQAGIQQVWVTIPEGLRRQEIALILDQAFKKYNSSQFDNQTFLIATQDLEGHLFPETYAFYPDASTQQVINKLTKQFDQITSKLNISFSELDKIIILASLLEREAQTPAEMSTIAGIIQKRLSAGWPLQIDATVQFAIANQKCQILDCDYWPRPLTKADLNTDSPYNTYLYTNLPPTPISNPGQAAIKAAANPTPSNYWFYLHDLKGQIHYAETAEQHNKNVCLYLKKDC